ncbi:OB-fold nucleic acid binding domain-containing protein [Dermatophilus congolensis]|uniref:OB-fold nucleic acid binding domain-containing protein n=1 Tax=Dermatophilus congolensis TaxID=1863 RepID=UPI001AAE5798|nr:OB-fold nucleic acid binding domain-containing protein [Dermatophilus congolensis]MBO3142978.1 OB-fold nucleic acid binding domain-containing protein [Dermatophilus congolensis]MBO3151967.1 OB-fold nucleic acid binding domain-containing protein [Dermatophilus congolensis]MBO3161025.1 OB-fold nucleic acid binding domain-containing protein [Dermatophilus congolensis]MBO3163251.1 OB-fold nucleic acid binding domain-containing protein [Dermatophilus congolensis]MBO3176808.1 OB-fold nucleic acid
MAAISSLLERLAGAQAKADDAALRKECNGCGATEIGDCADRGFYTMRGMVKSVTRPAAGSTPSISAEIFDGSGYLTLVWMGRREIPGIVPGVRMRVEGRVMRNGNKVVMHNPSFDVLAPASATK